MLNYYFGDTIDNFFRKNTEEIIGTITLSNQFDSNMNQNKSWKQQIEILKKSLVGLSGTIYFEFSIPRMGKRVDCILIIRNIVFVVEFKVGEKEYLSANYDQVWDYALDLKNFHKPSHNAILVPILLATEAKDSAIQIIETSHDDQLIKPLKVNKINLGEVIRHCLRNLADDLDIDGDADSISKCDKLIQRCIKYFRRCLKI